MQDLPVSSDTNHQFLPFLIQLSNHFLFNQEYSRILVVSATLHIIFLYFLHI